MRNRIKGLELINRVPDELWMEVHDTVQETGIKSIPMEKKCKKAKWLSGEKRKAKEKRKDIASECRVPKNNSKEREDSLPQLSMQRNRRKQ